MRVVLFSRYGSFGASSRVRYLQYLPYLNLRGEEISVVPLFSNTYIRALYAGGSRWRQVLAGYWRRLLALLSARRFDVVIVEKELFPFLPALAERLLLVMGVPYIVDYDDAMFHRYDQHPSILVRALLGRKIDAVMRHADVVVAGNKYLAERARLAGATQIEVIPSVVDAARYKPLPHEGSETPIVGWIGTPMTSRYLKPLIPVFQVLRNEFPVRFVAIGARSEEFEGTPIEARPWSEDTEVQSIQQIDIGIMPLQDSHWERGKCGYKLIQYMACGLPVVASPVGVNTEIVEHGVNGFLASDNARWLESLTALLSDAETRRRMGRKGREKVESWYCLQVQAPRLKRLIYQLTRLSELTISR